MFLFYFNRKFYLNKRKLHKNINLFQKHLFKFINFHFHILEEKFFDLYRILWKLEYFRL